MEVVSKHLQASYMKWKHAKFSSDCNLTDKSQTYSTEQLINISVNVQTHILALHLHHKIYKYRYNEGNPKTLWYTCVKSMSNGLKR